VKHIKTFEGYISSLNEASSFKEGDFVKWTTPDTGTQISFGVVTKVRGASFDAMVVATGGKGDEQPNRGLAIGLGGPVIWKPGITADEIKKEIKSLGNSSNSATGIKFQKASLWSINESRVNEANSDLGPKAKKFNSYIDLWDYFVDADDNKFREEALPKEWHDALTKLGIKADDAIVLFYDAWGDKKEVLDTAKKCGLIYAEVEDTEGGSDGIVFSMKQ